MHSRSDRAETRFVRAKTQMMQALSPAFDQQHLILLASVATEGERAATFRRSKTEGGIKAPAGFQIRDTERVAQQCLNRHAILTA